MIDFRRPNPFMAAMFLDTVVARMDKNARKAAILDELIDQAATFCAIRVSGDGFSISDAETGDMVSVTALRLAYDVWWTVHRKGWTACPHSWAEAEARLRNGEAWHLLIEVDQ